MALRFAAGRPIRVRKRRQIKARPSQAASRLFKLGAGLVVASEEGEDGATVDETGSGKPERDDAPRARGFELDPIRELPSGPAACDAPLQRPDTYPHATTRCTVSDSSCAEGGVHTCHEAPTRPVA
jgi:hypothetical protein